MISRDNKGITLIALVITIIVLLIIASISIVGGIEGSETAAENKLLTELDMVQHAVLQRYTKVQMTKEDVPGTKKNIEEVESISGPLNLTLKITNYPDESDKYQYYYELNLENLKELGITNAKDTYIVNYSTGEVLNITTQKTKSGKPLYIYAINNTENK